MKNLPKVSVIMSVYNGERYLSQAIESILNQTFKDFEFIIINDGSTDNSLKIIERYKKENKRIILINNRINSGLIKSLNSGLKIAKGKYIARMDDDDISINTRFSLQYDYLEKHPEIFLVAGGVILIDEGGKVIKKVKPIKKRQRLIKRLLIKNALFHPSIMFRNTKEIFYRDKMRYVEDYDFYLNILSRGKLISNISSYVLKCRIRPNSISSLNRAYQRLFLEEVKKFYYQRLQYGKDEYDKFDSKKIFDLDLNMSDNKIVIESNIISYFALNNFKKTKKYCNVYFHKYGYFNKFFIYYLATFFGKTILGIIIKFTPSNLLRYMNQ